MKIKIHKGTNEIGGNCVELSHGDCSLLLDIGLPLDPESVPAPVEDMKPSAILVSHPHQDHYGLMDMLDPDIPIYMGAVSHSLIDAVRLFTGGKALDNEIVHIKPWKEFEIGPFRIYPYLMDHSSSEAFAYLIEGGGKRVFYTGDFRAHGRKGILFDNLLKTPPQNIDVMIMEGTMLGRSNADFPDEKSVESKIVEIIENQENITFLLCSSQNIDRLVGAFRACIKSDKTMVIDAYTAWVLEKMKQVSRNVPAMDWEQVKVYIPGGQYQALKKHREFFGSFYQDIFNDNIRIKSEEVHSRAKDLLFIARPSMHKIIDKHLTSNPVNVIYSMWLGYIEDERYAEQNARVREYRDDPGVNFQYAHTSGHADLEQLKVLARAINARKLIPVHTEFAKDFTCHFENAMVLNDGEWLDA